MGHHRELYFARSIERSRTLRGHGLTPLLRSYPMHPDHHVPHFTTTCMPWRPRRLEVSA